MKNKKGFSISRVFPAIAHNVLQISEGANSVGLCEGIWAFAYVLLSAALLSNELLTIKQIKK
jgi:hypothetical protein